MFRSIFIYLSFIFFIGCNNQNKTFISGKIIKPTNNEILILKDEKVIKNISINSEGTFSSSLEVLNDGLYNFIHLPEFQYLIINKGDSLVLRLNSLDFDESLVFSGAGASKNNYLIDVFLDHEKEENYIKSNYKLSKIKFKRIVDSLQNIKTKHYLNYKSVIKTNFISDLIINHAILIPLYSHIENYIISNKKNHSNNIQYFKKYRDYIDLNISELSHFKPYLDYITLKSINESFSEGNGYDYNLNFNLQRLIYVDNTIDNQIIKTKLLRFIAYEYLLEEKLLILNNNNVILFWSYDQNSHQVNLFNKVNSLSIKHTNYHFNLININDDNLKWKNNYLNTFNSNRIDNFRTVNFESMSKKMVLNNLNKVIVTDRKGTIKEILTLTDLEKYLETN